MTKLKNFLARWNWQASERSLRRVMMYDDADPHAFRAERTNYEVHDIGMKNIRFPSGVRRVKTKKVKDSDGKTFYTFDENTPLA